ncbi:MAG: tautomerase family protein [Vallitaleaceae bacterium]|nr:tautomerase family protein [Vallitaleaceae bacterium]MBC7961097.1 tautomerase family protein [Vallitaleaceae bacterium]
MPIVNITLWPGRSKEQKSQLAQAITEDFVRIINAKPESVQIIFNEVDRSNWAIMGKLQDMTEIKKEE